MIGYRIHIITLMMKILFLFLSLFLSTHYINAQQIPVDELYRTGRLSNGLTYYIRHNEKEAKLADFFLAQRVGSILEEPQQRGLSHFLEHMAFNGSKHFPGTEKSPTIVHWCESHGIKFGTNLNAYTSVDETVYQLNAVPVSRQAILDSTLLILYDWSCGLLLKDKEIDKERGVVREEWRNRQSGMALQRMMEETLPTVFNGTKYADCLPIGHMSVVDNFAYEELRAYYSKWYRPDLQAIIVVGDVDVDFMEQRIRSLFGTIPAPHKAAERVYYPVPDNEQMIVATKQDSEQPIVLANLYIKHDATPEEAKGTESYLHEGYMDFLIKYMLNSRLQELLTQPVVPFLSASVRMGPFLISNTKDALALSFGCHEDSIRKSFVTAIGELERARRFGFTATEFERAKIQQLKGYERRVENSTNHLNRYFVNKALLHFLKGEPLITDSFDLHSLRGFLEKVTLKDVNKACKELINNHNQVLVVYGPDKPNFNLPTDHELASYVYDAQTAGYEAYQDCESDKPLISEMPEKGTIVMEKAYAHGATELTLSNGVKVYVKSVKSYDNSVSMRFWGNLGTRYCPDKDVPNFSFISSVITNAGVGDFDQTGLKRKLAGNSARVSLSISNDMQQIKGKSNPKDLETLFRLTYLYFTSPRKDRQAFESEVNRMRSFLTNREANPQVPYNDSLINILYHDSPRVQPIKLATLDKLNYDRILDIYRENFSNAAGFNMLLVGNVSLDTLRPLLCRYVASLPAKATAENTGRLFPYPDIVPGNKTHIFKRSMKTPTAHVGVYYTFDMPFNAKSDLTLDCLARILQTTYIDSVREEKGAVYGVSVSAQIDKDSKPSSLISIRFKTAPEKYEEIIPVIYKQVALMAHCGPSKEALDNVKRYLLKAHRQYVKRNGYWEHVLFNQLKNGMDIETAYEHMVTELTGDDVQQAAQQLLESNRRIEITMLPK